MSYFLQIKKHAKNYMKGGWFAKWSIFKYDICFKHYAIPCFKGLFRNYARLEKGFFFQESTEKLK